MARKGLDLGGLRPETRATAAGRDPARFDGAVNPAIHRASTLIIASVDDLYNTPKQTYALQGMAVQEALCEALAAVEGGAGAVLAPSGLAAITLALLTVARAGGDVLVTDSCYGPTRRFCDGTLSRLGVATRYYDPRIGADIAGLLRDTTCAVLTESPGSITFEIQDVPAIAAAAKARDVPVIIDNTWSAGVYFKPFEHGVDLSVQALTKYQAGHADLLLGAVVCADEAWRARVFRTFKELGLGAAPDDSYLALRGLRTMHARLAAQSASAQRIAAWLQDRPEVARVLHPAFASHPDHALWARDFSGASGLFGVVLQPASRERLRAMLEGYDLFAMGFSWGGFESLIVPSDDNITRTARPWRAEGPLLRLSIGLEHPDDLIADLERGFARLAG
jgi:cystathionine beta-lyase